MNGIVCRLRESWPCLPKVYVDSELFFKSCLRKGMLSDCFYAL